MDKSDSMSLTVGQATVSVAYSALAGRFDWCVELPDGSRYEGTTPPTPARYLNGVGLKAALASVIYALSLCAKPSPPIRSLIRFPFGVIHWAASDEEAIEQVLAQMPDTWEEAAEWQVV